MRPFRGVYSLYAIDPADTGEAEEESLGEESAGRVEPPGTAPFAEKSKK